MLGAIVWLQKAAFVASGESFFKAAGICGPFRLKRTISNLQMLILGYVFETTNR